MSATREVKLSEAEVRRQAADKSVRDLRDPRHPGLYLRFWSNRERGTWHLVRGKKWVPIARWPDLGVAAVLAELPALRQRLMRSPATAPVASGMANVGQLLDWYGNRMARDRSLSAKRKAGARSAIAQHLKPRLDDLALAEVTADALDKQLMWPCQAELSLSYLRQMFALLLTAFRQAQQLGLIDRNPMAGMRFNDFTKAKIMPKAARLRDVQLPELMQQLAQAFDAAPGDAMLALMMLAHGTRIGETRMARWSEISLAAAEWFIPAANTKTRTEHRLPLTAQVEALLVRYRAIQQGQGYEGVYLFPNRRGLSLSETQASAVFTRLGQGEWTSHDLRKVSRSTWTDLGIDGHIGEMLLNHTLGKIASTYIHTQAMQQRRVALEKWHAWLDQVGFVAIHRLTKALSENSQNSPQATAGVASSDLTAFVISEDSKC
ncbi:MULTISPECIES: site-specific integrase [unclassified Pseudomonas]|uniref:tyrosine-type recombinase/integrase n=1 Tax=unclassified Pseudomonas TaxID=196821 RepID=UPI000A0A064C|nr:MULTISPECIES: site-specific integrase [unclassified Pseudomonas]SMF36844.1 Integrase [Pseudomonas sp. LAIL14HWK12:I11]SMR78974.1 Integrase [Pseudomonas sp. LAIL14HWK12:I10]SOD04732.1 Integrase [Pseudomonas sp. LAIL14HWK12:I8]